MRSPFKRRLGAAAVATMMVATGTAGAVALAGATATNAFAAYPGPTKVTYNDNACTNAASPNNPSATAISVGADQNYAAIANGVNTTTGLSLLNGVTVGTATATGAGLPAPSTGILAGSSSTLTNVGGDGFVSAAFLQAGVGLGLINIGGTVTANIATTINAYGGATFGGSTQPTALPWNVSPYVLVNPTRVVVSGSGGGTVIGTGSGPTGVVTAPLDAQVAYADIPYTAPTAPTTNVNMYFAQDATPLAPLVLPGTGTGTVANSSVHVLANIGLPSFLALGCTGGTVTAAIPPATINTWVQTPQTGIKVFAAVAIQPPLPPTLVPQTVPSVNLGGQVVIHAGAGAIHNVPITSFQLVGANGGALHGTATINAANGDVTYTATSGSVSVPADTLLVTATTIGGTSAPPTVESITTIVTNAPNCNASAPGPNCAIKQIVVVPVNGADLTMSQSSGLPQDVLGRTVGLSGCTGPAVTLNGQPQLACGAMWPITVVNARGTDTMWTLTGQVSDFLDPTLPSTATCSTIATYQNHCIPGGNMSWIPAAGVAHAIVPGDVAQVSPGAAILNIGSQAPTLANTAALGNATAGPFGVGAGAAIAAYSGAPGQTPVATQTNPVTEMAPYAGLHVAAQTLCTAAATKSGGTFVCGAGLVVAVPASAAAAPFTPAVPPASGTGGYQATLTLTLF